MTCTGSSFSLPLFETLAPTACLGDAVTVVLVVLVVRVRRVSFAGEMSWSKRSVDDEASTDRRVDRVLDGPASAADLVEGDIVPTRTAQSDDTSCDKKKNSR